MLFEFRRSKKKVDLNDDDDDQNYPKKKLFN